MRRLGRRVCRNPFPVLSRPTGPPPAPPLCPRCCPTPYSQSSPASTARCRCLSLKRLALPLSSSTAQTCSNTSNSNLRGLRPPQLPWTSTTCQCSMKRNTTISPSSARRRLIIPVRPIPWDHEGPSCADPATLGWDRHRLEAWDRRRVLWAPRRALWAPHLAPWGPLVRGAVTAVGCDLRCLRDTLRCHLLPHLRGTTAHPGPTALISAPTTA